MQGAGERDVVDVVTRLLGHRSLLAPARHPPVDQPRVAIETDIGTETEPLGDPGTHALEEHIGGGDEVQRDVPARRVLEIDADRAPVSSQERAERIRRSADTIHPDDLGSHVAEQHAAKRHGSDGFEFDDAQSV